MKNYWKAEAEDFINMKIELISVIEIEIYIEEIPFPQSGPYWEFADEWEEYHLLTNAKAGFSNHLKPYSKGSSFYRISDISDADLLRVIQKEIDRQKDEDHPEIVELACPLTGGFVLRINGADIYYPQCCGDLSAIECWNDLLADEDSYFYMGHPSPKIIKTEKTVIFDFLNSEIQEHYTPPVKEDQIEIDKDALRIALEKVNQVINNFAKRLVKINEIQNLNIPGIDRILVYGKNDH
ncbi:hypothetical protein [uncultured Chryseobacterium sp.]|uniref:hypothetical protein n=1 Tax=uncultured Chryseobacterium sp. TaxID=259322 RepID=UPI0025D1E35A|nr:hypothetical protein [uncultured Chryseobacterium sp.]